MKLQLDECPDANGYFTLRPHDGTANGDIYAKPIATVYDAQHADLIVKAVNLDRELNHVSIAAKRLLDTAKQRCKPTWKSIKILRLEVDKLKLAQAELYKQYPIIHTKYVKA